VDRDAADEVEQRGLGIAVAKLREEAGWTTRELVARTGLSPSTIRAIERGSRGTTWNSRRQLAGGLGVKLSYLLELAIDLAPGPEGEELRRERDSERANLRPK
jgi:transcriptional regulator with XRE-family HTH domain